MVKRFDMNWISVKDRLLQVIDENDERLLCWVVKRGEFGVIEDGYPIFLYYDKIWFDFYKCEIHDYENNPDYMCVTHWCKIETP